MNCCVNRLTLQVTESVDDVVGQNRMQRRLGQLTETCFQRCVGMDAINSLYSVTFEMGDLRHRRFREFVVRMQEQVTTLSAAR